MEISALSLAGFLSLTLLLHAGVYKWLGSSLAPPPGVGLAPWAVAQTRRFLAEDKPIPPYVLADEVQAFRKFHVVMTPTQNNFFVPPRNRNDIGSLLEAMGFTSGAELGVQVGGFADHTLRNWPSCKKYILVDLWAQQQNYKDFANVDQSAQDKNYEETKQRLKPFDGKTLFIRNYTTNAALQVADASLDYVYVDARHDMCGTYEDITTWWPKVRPGGLIAGHDYRHAQEVKVSTGQDWSLCMDGTTHHGAVMGAVNSFAMLHGLHVSVTWGVQDNDWPSWFIRKPIGHAHSHHSQSNKTVQQ